MLGLYVVTSQYDSVDSIFNSIETIDNDISAFKRTVSTRILRHQGRLKEALVAYQESIDWEKSNDGSQHTIAWNHLFRGAIYHLFLDQEEQAQEEVKKAAAAMTDYDKTANDMQNMLGAMAANYAGVGLYAKADSILLEMQEMLENAGSQPDQ